VEWTITLDSEPRTAEPDAERPHEHGYDGTTLRQIGMSVANWYRHGRALTRAEVLDRYVQLATVMVGG
jgi:hypothetical protein